MEKNDRCIVFLSNIRGNLDGLLGVVRAVCGDKDPFDQSSRSPFPEPEFRMCPYFWDLTNVPTLIFKSIKADLSALSRES